MFYNPINIITFTSGDARSLALSEISSEEFKPEEFIIQYDKGHGLPNIVDSKANVPESYPLTIKGLKNDIPVAIHVYCVTAGYAGTGPHDMLDIVRATGFPIDPDAILTDKWGHHEKFLIQGTKSGMKDLLKS